MEPPDSLPLSLHEFCRSQLEEASATIQAETSLPESSKAFLDTLRDVRVVFLRRASISVFVPRRPSSFELPLQECEKAIHTMFQLRVKLQTIRVAKYISKGL